MALSRPCAVISALVVSLSDINAVVEKPVDVLWGVDVVPWIRQLQHVFTPQVFRLTARCSVR